MFAIFCFDFIYARKAQAQSQARRAVVVEMPCARDLECSRHSTMYLCCFTNLRTFGYKSIIQDWYNLSLVVYSYLGYINFNLSMVKIHIPVYHLQLHT